MVWLAAVLATLVLGLVVALAIPVQLEFSAELTDRLRGRARFRWWFAAISVGAREAVPPKRPSEPRARGRVAQSPGRRRSPIAVLRTQGLIARVIRLVRDLVGTVHIHDFRLRLRYGFDDPADTGQLWGALTPVFALVSVRGLDVRCLPDFAGASFSGTCNGTVMMRPLSVVVLLLAFLVSPPVWRAARAWRRAS